MDPVSLAASVAAFLQITDRVIGLCKHYIESIKNAPHSLRLILIETSSLECVLQSLEYLLGVDPEFLSQAARNLWLQGSTIDACKQALAKIEQLLSDGSGEAGNTDGTRNRNKRRKISDLATTLAWPLKEKKALQILEGVSKYKATITLALSAESSRDIKEVKTDLKEIQGLVGSSENRKFYEWLEVTNPSELHLKSSEVREKDTGMWVLKLPSWEEWITRRIRCLWIHGIPGSGKTVLASWLTKNTPKDQSNCKPVASVYYYCYFGHNQDETIPLLSWVISQLCRQLRVVPRNLLFLYNRNLRPSVQHLLDCLEEILNAFDCIYITVDALDESLEPRDQFLKTLEIISTEPRFKNIQLLLTSREYYDIQYAISTLARSIEMKVDSVQADIHKYVQRQMQEQRRFSTWPEKLRDEVENILTVGAKGMFRWAVCQIDVLKRQRSVDDVRSSLSSLPETLDETYERIFTLIPAYERKIIFPALLLLCGYAQLSPINVKAQILLSLVTGNWNSEEQDSSGSSIYNLEMLEETCGCLVTISKTSESFGEAKLAHFTVKEFLFSERVRNNCNSVIRGFALSSDMVQQELLRYLLFVGLHYQGPDSVIPDSVNELYDHVVFFSYWSLKKNIPKLCSWGLDSMALQFLQHQGRHYSNLRRLLEFVGKGGEKERNEISDVYNSILGMIQEKRLGSHQLNQATVSPQINTGYDMTSNVS